MTHPIYTPTDLSIDGLLLRIEGPEISPALCEVQLLNANRCLDAVSMLDLDNVSQISSASVTSANLLSGITEVTRRQAESVRTVGKAR